MKYAYIEKRFQAKTLRVIEQANAIIAEYAAAGFRLTLRQLYYQFVARDLLPNKQQSYDRLGIIVGDARMAGLIDWDAIEDRTRSLRGNNHWDGPEDIIHGAARSFRLDTWEGQKHRVEVWIEKDALVGVIEPTCVKLDVDFFSCRGYASLSSLRDAGQRMLRYAHGGQQPVIVHLGDHDPSGIDMTRDIQDRMDVFCGGGVVHVDRVALTMEQINELNPPPNPAKTTDSRYAEYRETYGDDSWELDALDPTYMANLIKTSVEGYCQKKKRQAVIRDQERNREQLTACAEEWDDVVSYMDGCGYLD